MKKIALLISIITVLTSCATTDQNIVELSPDYFSGYWVVQEIESQSIFGWDIVFDEKSQIGSGIVNLNLFEDKTGYFTLSEDFQIPTSLNKIEFQWSILYRNVQSSILTLTYKTYGTLVILMDVHEDSLTLRYVLPGIYFNIESNKIEYGYPDGLIYYIKAQATRK